MVLRHSLDQHFWSLCMMYGEQLIFSLCQRGNDQRHETEPAFKWWLPSERWMPGQRKSSHTPFSLRVGQWTSAFTPTYHVWQYSIRGSVCLEFGPLLRAFPTCTPLLLLWEWRKWKLNKITASVTSHLHYCLYFWIFPSGNEGILLLLPLKLPSCCRSPVRVGRCHVQQSWVRFLS